MRTTRAFDLAARLATATGGRARIRRLPGGGFRVEAELPAELDRDAHLEMLAALSSADRFGHQYIATVHLVWAELDEESVQ
ncbi:hypothetical protein ACGFX4_30275 [Kitasatospora sp. NPDC048365]|uniref:Uncharacterized protein n=1 Tax=Kitasatospora terrestris TaxID=258051 RepID=A0ABP9E033_9ACTN